MVLSDYNISKYSNDEGIIKEVINMISHFNEDEKKKADARFAEDQERTFLTLCQKNYDEGLEKGIEQGLEKGIEQGLEKGIEQGIEQGLEQRSIEIAKSMLNKKMGIELISELLIIRMFPPLSIMLTVRNPIDLTSPLNPSMVMI